MIIPYGIHDVHGTTNWLRLQPTLIPWNPHGIPDGFHGFHMDSIWINPGKVKTSPSGPQIVFKGPVHRTEKKTETGLNRTN
jgi:hypothetical protein